MRRLTRVFIAVAGTCALAPAGAQAATVTPFLVPGNPSCADVQGAEVWTELKKDSPRGVVVLDDGVVTATATIADDKKSLSFTAAPGVDAVIVKAGAEANVYVYDPDSTGDTGLVVPPSNADISHVSFCYGPDAPVKPAVSIDKSTSTGTINAGDVAKFAVTVANGGTAAAQNLVVEDLLPAGPAWSFDGAAPAGCAIGDVTVGEQSRQKVTCTVAALAAGASFTFNVLATTTQATCATYNNTASATGANTGPIAPDSAMVECVKLPELPPPGPSLTPTGSTPSDAQPAPAPAPQGQVLGQSILIPGSAKLSGPSGCLPRPASKVYVTGKQIRSVRFLLDGKTLRTVTKRDKAGRYAVTITRSKMTPGTHRVHAVVTFTTASKTKQRTLQLRFSRCGEVKPSRARGFTG